MPQHAATRARREFPESPPRKDPRRRGARAWRWHGAGRRIVIGGQEAIRLDGIVHHPAGDRGDGGAQLGRVDHGGSDAAAGRHTRARCMPSRPPRRARRRSLRLAIHDPARSTTASCTNTEARRRGTAARAAPETAAGRQHEFTRRSVGEARGPRRWPRPQPRRRPNAGSCRHGDARRRPRAPPGSAPTSRVTWSRPPSCVLAPARPVPSRRRASCRAPQHVLARPRRSGRRLLGAVKRIAVTNRVRARSPSPRLRSARPPRAHPSAARPHGAPARR